MSFVKDAFVDRTVLVTGAGWGLGRGIAHAFAAHGARVFGCDVNADGLAETARSAPQTMNVERVDVTARAEVQGFVDVALRATGRVDVLINDAGGLCGQTGVALEEVPEADFDAIMAANVTSTFLASAAVTPHMKQQRYGRIVNISSGAGLTLTVTNIQAYTAAKAAVIGLTRQLAHELGPFGITVNCVAPGMIPCNPYAQTKWESQNEAERSDALEKIATRRVGRPADIANAVMFSRAKRRIGSPVKRCSSMAADSLRLRRSRAHRPAQLVETSTEFAQRGRLAIVLGA